MVDVPPGAYEVQIVAAGYETQKRRVQVEENGVTLLNIDLAGGAVKGALSRQRGLAPGALALLALWAL